MVPGDPGSTELFIIHSIHRDYMVSGAIDSSQWQCMVPPSPLPPCGGQEGSKKNPTQKNNWIMGFCIFIFPPSIFLYFNSNMKIGGNCTICGVADFIRNKGWSITLCGIFSLNMTPISSCSSIDRSYASNIYHFNKYIILETMNLWHTDSD